MKERLVKEQKARTERRVRQLLQQDIEISDDSEEDNRVTDRQRGRIDRQPRQIVRLLGLSLVVCSLVCLRLSVCCRLVY